MTTTEILDKLRLGCPEDELEMFECKYLHVLTKLIWNEAIEKAADLVQETEECGDYVSTSDGTWWETSATATISEAYRKVERLKIQ